MEEQQKYQQPTETQPPSQVPVQETPKKKKGGKLWIVLLIILGIIIAICAGAFLFFKQTPQYSLYLMTKAIEKKDYNSFSKYFNVDAVVDDLLDKVIVESLKQMQAQATTADPAQAQLTQQYFETLIPQLREQMKEQFKAEIKKQTEEGKSSFSSGGALIGLFLNTKVKINGSEADVVIVDKEKNQNLPLKMRKKGGYWEIYKINAEGAEIQKLMQPK